MTFSLPTLEVPDYTDGNDLPISIADFKIHGRIVTTNEDSLIEAFIRAATQKAERDTKLSLGPYVYQYNLDQFPYENNDLGLLQAAPIRLLKGPVSQVTNVTYVDPNGNVTEAVLGTDYIVDLNSVPARVAPVYNNPWPPAQNYLSSVSVTYAAGFGSFAKLDPPAPKAIPEPILQAIRLLAATWYDQREALAGIRLEELPTPFGYTAIVGQYAVRRL